MATTSSKEVTAMRAVFRATLVAVAVGMLLTANVLAKGENGIESVNVTIGPIDDMSAGTPTRVTAQVTESAQITSGLVGAYLSFYEPVSRDQLEFSLNYDQAAGAYVALVTLPHEGRWLIDAGTRYGTGSTVPYGGSDGTHIVTVRPAAPPAAPAFPAAPFLAGAAAASLAWLLGFGTASLRRRRTAAAAIPASVSRQVPV
jgi:hypothetical protein